MRRWELSASTPSIFSLKHFGLKCLVIHTLMRVTLNTSAIRYRKKQCLFCAESFRWKRSLLTFLQVPRSQPWPQSLSLCGFGCTPLIFHLTNVSYSASLSERHARKARGITSSLKWKYLFDNIFLLKYKKTLQIITQNKNGMTNNFKGERFNTSVDGSITGMHADFIIKDDMQDPQQASSDTQREHANHWDEATLTSRHKKPNSWLDIIIAQRLHESDLTGYTLNKKHQSHTNFIAGRNHSGQPGCSGLRQSRYTLTGFLTQTDGQRKSSKQ